MGSSLISSHGRKWRGGGARGRTVSGRLGGRARQPCDQLRTLHTAVGAAALPVDPLPSSPEWAKLRGQLILPGLLTIIITPPTEKKCLPVTCPSLPVPLWFPPHVCCWLPWRWLPWALPWFLWGGSCPSPKTHSWGDLGGLPWGLFQAECVWSLMPQIPQGPPDFCLWEGVTATYLDRMLGRV